MEGYKPFLQEVLRLHELTKRGSFFVYFFSSSISSK